MVLAGALAVAPHAARGDPAERVSGVGTQSSVNLTIYNGGLSLVHDRRHVRLDAGENHIAWRDVSGQLQAETAILTDLSRSDAVAVLEQNFDFDLLTPSALLAKYVGRDVIVVHDAPESGRPKRESARLLANNDGVILQYPDRIESGLYGSHITFPGIPGALRDRPTLVLDLSSNVAGTQALDLAYLTGGLGWHADYIGIVAPDERSMSLDGLVTLTNTTGTTFRNARLQLVAGNVNVANSGMQQTIDAFGASAKAAPVTQESYFEYHLYTVHRPTTVAGAQTKQIALLSARGVPLRKTLELRGSPSYYSTPDADLGAKLNVGVYLTFTNKGGELGIPLPGGVVRLYKSDARGTSQFLGSDSIEHTPRDQDVRLHVGDSFDVTARKKQTDFKGFRSCMYESAYEVAISNAKDDAQDVLVVEPIPGTWSVLEENEPHVKSSSATATWSLHVPARAMQTLRYRVRVSLCF